MEASRAELAAAFGRAHRRDHEVALEPREERFLAPQILGEDRVDGVDFLERVLLVQRDEAAAVRRFGTGGRELAEALARLELPEAVASM